MPACGGRKGVGAVNRILRITAAMAAVLTGMGLMGSSFASLPGGADTFRHITPYIVVLAAMVLIIVIFSLGNRSRK